VKYYLSGAITGYPNFKEYFEKHQKAIEAVVSETDDVFNPASVAWDHDVAWETCMKYDICKLMYSDCLVLLPNWKKSRGAKLEVYLCRKLNIQIVKFDVLIKSLKVKSLREEEVW